MIRANPSRRHWREGRKPMCGHGVGIFFLWLVVWWGDNKNAVNFRHLRDWEVPLVAHSPRLLVSLIQCLCLMSPCLPPPILSVPPCKPMWGHSVGNFFLMTRCRWKEIERYPLLPPHLASLSPVSLAPVSLSLVSMSPVSLPPCLHQEGWKGTACLLLLLSALSVQNWWFKSKV